MNLIKLSIFCIQYEQDMKLHLSHETASFTGFKWTAKTLFLKRLAANRIKLLIKIKKVTPRIIHVNLHECCCSCVSHRSKLNRQTGHYGET